MEKTLNSKITNLTNRALIEISGEDNKKFLQGLITNDVNKIDSNQLIFSAMLNYQGRFLYDFFVFKNGQNILIECSKDKLEEIISKLSLYKLKSKISITKNDDYLVFSIINQDQESLKQIQDKANFMFNDPRNQNMGLRCYIEKSKISHLKFDEDDSFYKFTRIKNLVIEGSEDMVQEKSFILEFGFNEMNAIDYNKGCYIGQELTARTHHLGQIRKKIIYIKTKNNNIKQHSVITLENQEIGKFLSCVFFDDFYHFLAIIESEKFDSFMTMLE